MTSLQNAWAIYLAGSLGCTLAAWWMFLWAWRFVRYAAVATVIALLFPPYAIDSQTMTMAPAIYSLVFDLIGHEAASMHSVLKLIVGVWLIGLILAALLAVLIRPRQKQPYEPDPEPSDRRPVQPNSRRLGGHSHSHKSYSRGLSREEYQARDELLKGEIPIRAIRD